MLLDERQFQQLEEEELYVFDFRDKSSFRGGISARTYLTFPAAPFAKDRLTLVLLLAETVLAFSRASPPFLLTDPSGSTRFRSTT